MSEVQTIIRKEVKFDLKSNLILAMCFGYIVHFFLHSPILNLILFSICLIVFLFSLKGAKPLPRYFSIAMLGLGIILNIGKGGFQDIVLGMQANLPLLCLIILVPMLSIPLKNDGYFNSIQYYLEKWSSDNRKIFGSFSLFLFCLGPILNLGSIRILHETIKDFKNEPILLAKSYLVGFSTVIIWSPYFASVALVLYYLKVPLFDFIPLGLTFAVVQLIIGNILFWVWLKKNRPEGVKSPLATTLTEANKTHNTKLLHLLYLILFLMGIIFSMEYITKWPMMFIVSVVSLVFPLVWSIVKQKQHEFLSSFKEYKTASVPGMNNEIVLFLSAGLFAKSLTGTVIADSIKLFLTNTAILSFFLFIITVMVIILVLTFIGIHQIVVVTILATQLNPELIGTSPEVLALLLMVSWSMSSVLSPVNPLNLLVSSSINQSGIAVGFKWNGLYLLSMFIIGTLFIYMIH